MEHQTTSTKQPRLVLAGASIQVVPEKYLREIIAFVGPVQRDLCKRITSILDANKTVLTVKEESVLEIGINSTRVGHLYSIQNAVRSYVSKCINLQVIKLVYESAIMLFGPSLSNFMEELIVLAPKLIQIQTMETDNWFVQTNIGNQFYRKYSPDIALSVMDVMQIVCRSLMASDINTLIRFGMTQTLNDLNETYGIVRISDVMEHFPEMRMIKACVHFHNYDQNLSGVRRVALKQNKTGVWSVFMIGTFVVFRKKCYVCEYV